MHVFSVDKFLIKSVSICRTTKYIYTKIYYSKLACIRYNDAKKTAMLSLLINIILSLDARDVVLSA